MSYNYDQCVQSIQEPRRRAYANNNINDASSTTTTSSQHALPDLEALQQSMDGFATLSKHCPMTPLLWMQYAHDTEVLMEGLIMLESSSSTENGTNSNNIQQQLQQLQAKKSALESSTGILELALSEFSGCALLHLYYLETLADYIYSSEMIYKLNTQNEVVGMEVDDKQATLQKLSTAFEHAWKCVCSGSHVNEGLIISEIYQLQGSFLLYLLSSAKDNNTQVNTILQQLSNLFLKWSKTPMGDGSNGEMMQDIDYLWNEACSLILLLSNGEEEKLKYKQELDQQKVTLWSSIDIERKKTSSLMNTLSSYENEMDVAMSNEGIMLPRMSLFPPQQDDDEGIDLTVRYLQSLQRSGMKWNQILVSDTNRFLSGLGGSETSRAFTRAISYLQRIYQDMMKKSKASNTKAELSPLEDYVATYKDSAITSLYERAISECPTVESLWVSYMNFLRGEWTRYQSKVKEQKHMLKGEELYLQQQQRDELSSMLQSTSHRAVRNCPYSSTLFEIRMTTLGMVSTSNLEPDDVTAVVLEATQLGFLTHNREAMLHLRLTAILVVKRGLLSLVSMGTTTSTNGVGKDYDEEEDVAPNMSVASNKKQSSRAVLYQSLNPTVTEEVQDLVDDIRDMYDETDNFLFKSHPKWVEGKVAFWKHRAQTEAYVLCPIVLALKEADDEMVGENDNGGAVDKEAIKCFEKLVKAQKPSHPDPWRDYIRYISSSQLYLPTRSSDTGISAQGIAVSASTLRKVRGLYQRAMNSMRKAGQEEGLTTVSPPVPDNKQAWMGKGIDGAMFCRDYDIAISDLCREYLDFERTAGSEEGFANAQILVRSKLANLTTPISAPAPVVQHQEANGKRKLEPDDSISRPVNGASTMMVDNQEEEESNDTQSRSKRVKVVTNLKQPKKTDGVHKVRIGKMDYPAHPFTIHVSNLSKETQDMDLVDAFRSEFGAIVHAKILREKRTGKGGHHYHGESKCAGLVQFEERSSVESALQQSGKFEVGGQLIKIQRSHLPAVGLVPAGMHRVNPKGEGKSTKKNKFKKEAKMKVDTDMNVDKNQHMKSSGGNGKKKSHVEDESPSAISLSVLSFKPRGMRQKPKISLTDDSKKK